MHRGSDLPYSEYFDQADMYSEPRILTILRDALRPKLLSGDVAETSD